MVGSAHVPVAEGGWSTGTAIPPCADRSLRCGPMSGEQPLQLVVVSGVPAAGKTTTARRLASDLGAPLLWRGALRRAVLEPIAASFPNVQNQIPAATDRLVSAAVETAVAAGPVVLDANLHNDHQRQALRGLIERLDLSCFEVYLWGEPETLLRRLEQRADPPLTEELRQYVEAVHSRPHTPALEGLAPAAQIDTTTFDQFDAEYQTALKSIGSRREPQEKREAGAVVLISGLPAAGKSTLARRLGADLAAPVVWRDGLRRKVLADIGSASTDIGPAIPAASDALVRAVLEPLLAAGRTVVLDGNFNNAVQARAIVDFLAGTPSVRAFEVCLWGDQDTLRERFIARADPPLTDQLRPYFETVLARDRTPVLRHPTPCVHLDTTDLSSADRSYADLLDQIRQHVAC